MTYNPYGPGAQAPRRRRGGCLRSLVIGVVVLVILLVAADFVAKAVAQNVAASQIQKQGFPKKPSVTIEGFPFLTQVASHDLHQVRLSASDVPEGPVEITAVHAVANNIHLNSGFNSGTIGQVSGTVLISFGSLSSTVTKELGPVGQLVASSGLHLSAAGPDEVKASVDLVVASGSATWRVSRTYGTVFTPKHVRDAVTVEIIRRGSRQMAGRRGDHFDERAAIMIITRNKVLRNVVPGQRERLQRRAVA